MKIVYMATTGAGDATKASIPFHLALNGSLEVGDEPSFLFAGDATELLAAGAADKVEGLGLPPLRDLFAKLADHALPVYV